MKITHGRKPRFVTWLLRDWYIWYARGRVCTTESMNSNSDVSSRLRSILNYSQRQLQSSKIISRQLSQYNDAELSFIIYVPSGKTMDCSECTRVDQILNNVLRRLYFLQPLSNSHPANESTNHHLTNDNVGQCTRTIANLLVVAERVNPFAKLCTNSSLALNKSSLVLVSCCLGFHCRIIHHTLCHLWIAPK